MLIFFCLLNPLSFYLLPLSQIENLQEQLRDKDKQLGNLKDRVKSLQTDSSNTDTALVTLEEALSEKVPETVPNITRGNENVEQKHIRSASYMQI